MGERVRWNGPGCMTINAPKARVVMPGDTFDADEIPAESLAAFCARPVGAPRATVLVAKPAPVPAAPRPVPPPVPAPAVVLPAPVVEAEPEKKPRRGWKGKR